MNKNLNIGALFQKFGLMIILVCMCILVGVLSPSFFTATNILNVFRQVSMNGILAIGMTFVLITGNIDISVGSLVAVSGVMVGEMLETNSGLTGVFLAVLVAILVCMCLSLISGSMVAFFKVPPMIATLSMMTIARGMALVISNGQPYILRSEMFAVIGKGSLGLFPLPALIFIVTLIIFWIVLNMTTFGRKVYAVGGNIKAATASGINCKKVILTVYGLMGALAGLSGIILASRIGSGSPAIAEGYEMDAIAACVIGGTSTLGGTGKLQGTLLGVLIIGLISNALSLLNINSYWQQIVKGLIIAFAVIIDTYTKAKEG